MSGSRNLDCICLLICGLALFLFGGHALVAWHGWQSLLPDFLWMTSLIQYDSAWAFVLCGVGLMAFRSRSPIVVALCSGAAMLIGLARLLDYFIPGMAFSVTPVLVHPWLPAGVYDDLSPLVALAFVISGYMIGALKYPPYSVARSVILESLGFILIVLALLFVIGSYNSEPFGQQWLYFDDLDALNAIGFLTLGVSVLCFIFVGSDEESRQARRWAPTAVWLAVFTGTLGLWQGLRIEGVRQVRAGTDAVLAAVSKDLGNEMDLRIRALERFATRWDASGVRHRQWREEAEQLLRDIPEFRAIGWADPELTMQWIAPAGPAGGNLLRDNVHGAAAKVARSSRNPALTKSVDLRIGGRGFQAYVPVYHMEQFQGLVVGTFVNENWVASLLGERFPRHAITVLEGDEVHFQSRLKEGGGGEGWSSEKPLVLYNNEWRLRVAPTQATLSAASSALPEAVLAGGTLLATLLAAAVFLYQIAGRRARSLGKANNLLALDIEARKQTEQALRESERTNRVIINGIVDHAIFLLDADGKISSWNKGAEQLTGYRTAEAIGCHLSQFYQDVDSEPVEKKLATAKIIGWYKEECWHQRKDGSRFCGDDVISPIRGDDGNTEGFVVITRDQTERIELRRETEQARDYYLRLFSSFPNLVWRSDAAGQCDYCNPGWLEYTGRSHEQEIGTGWLDGLHPDDRAAWIGAFAQSLKNRDPFEIQFRLRRADGQYGWIICSCRPYYNMQGDLAGYLASCYDNTIRRRMEAEIANSRERILAFSRHLQAAREEEKAHVARELHDELGATLTALRLEVSALLKRAPGQPAAGAPGYRGAIQLADSAIQSIRKIITDLRPSILDNLGLLAALKWYAGDFSRRTDIKVDVFADEEITVAEENALAFFRIAQEALTNVLKHAHARSVTIRFAHSESNDVLEIIDDGVGMIEEATAKPASNGILGMRDRARHLHGELTIISVPGNGTTVTVTLPLKNPAT